MEEELISKKELLEYTAISYGQLYRWKRKGLIPEDWFIKKSSYTGQETFFPRERVLARIDKIKSMKEDISLDDLADVFSPAIQNLSLSQDDLRKRNLVTSVGLALYLEFRGDRHIFSYSDIFSLYLLDRLIVAGTISQSEGRLLLDLLDDAQPSLTAQTGEIYLLRKLGIFICFLLSPPAIVHLDKESRLISQINLAKLAEELKIKLM